MWWVGKSWKFINLTSLGWIEKKNCQLDQCTIANEFEEKDDDDYYYYGGMEYYNHLLMVNWSYYMMIHHTCQWILG